jgi:PAS domain S-box-containing protein
VLTDAGDKILEPHHGQQHFVRMYHDDDVLLAELVDFADRALQAAARVIVIGTPAHRAHLHAALAERGRAKTQQGHLTLLDADEALAQFMVDGWPDEERFEASIGAMMAEACAAGGPVSAFGEMVAALCEQGRHDAALRLEQLWNTLAQRLRFTLFCAYPWRVFPTSEHSAVFQRVCAEHDHAASLAPAPPSAQRRHAMLDQLRTEQQALALEAEVARRQHVEHALGHRERELSDFVENAAEGLHRVGADGTILWANKAELQMLGYQWEEYVGRHIAEFHLDAHVIDNILSRLASGQTLYDQPARLRCRDGSVKHVLIHSNGCFEDGELRYTRCFMRDATELHERDQALAQRDLVLLNAPVAAALLAGPDLAFRLVNRRFRELADGVELEGKAFYDVFPGLRDSELKDLLERVFTSAGPLFSDEVRLELRGADERYFKFSLEPLVLTPAGHGVILVAADVTEQVHSRQAVERANREREGLLAELTAASRAKDEFLAMLGHELRNPLAPIVSALHLMRLRGEPAASRERDIIQRQVDHLVRLVDDLLDVSRVTRGKIDLKFERVELGQALARAVEMARPLLDRRCHRLELDIEPGLYCQGDGARLAQVVANLLTNAARYTDPGGHVVLRAWRDGADSLCISVKDDGRGLDPAMLAPVFGLFVQGERGIDRSEGGLGIGLALVKNIVELHGGRVEARSEGRGRGSEFIVTLPAHDDGDETAVPAPASVPRQAARRRILVVDDNVDAGVTLGRLFEAHGHQVEVLHDPHAALAAAQRFLPEIAVLDIGLPGLDGYQLAARLREVLGTHPCRLVALTGYGQESDKARCHAAGFELHLVKPISAEQVASLAG